MDSKREGNLGHTVGVKLGRFSFVLAALFLVASFAAPAEAAGAKWVTKRIGWSGPGAGVSIGTGGSDTLMVTDEADTNRTIQFSTGDWAWETILDRSLTASSPNPDSTIIAATVVITSQKTNAAAQDTIWVTPEYCWNGLCGRVSMAAAASFPCAIRAQMANGGSTATVPYTLNSTPAAVYIGFLKVDPNSLIANNILGVPQMRLLVTGDVSATTPQANACRLWISYPQRTQP